MESLSLPQDVAVQGPSFNKAAYKERIKTRMKSLSSRAEKTISKSLEKGTLAGEVEARVKSAASHHDSVAMPAIGRTLYHGTRRAITTAKHKAAKHLGLGNEQKTKVDLEKRKIKASRATRLSMRDIPTGLALTAMMPLGVVFPKATVSLCNLGRSSPPAHVDSDDEDEDLSEMAPPPHVEAAEQDFTDDEDSLSPESNSEDLASVSPAPVLLAAAEEQIDDPVEQPEPAPAPIVEPPVVVNQTDPVVAPKTVNVVRIIASTVFVLFATATLVALRIFGSSNP